MNFQVFHRHLVWPLVIFLNNNVSGAMLIGMALPRNSGGQIARQALSERLEDLTSLLFLPLFFTISGFRTHLTKLSVHDWGVCVLLLVVSFFTKVAI